MHRLAPVALATLLAAFTPALLCAQAPTPFTVPPASGHFTDPANLAGERVSPRNGRELPIDGGIGADGKPDNALGLAQMLRKLNTRASLMLIVAHPDDEDGGMLAYYSRGLGARVGVLTLTRGEGGQNQMTGDFEDALGLLRTQELLAADRYMGVDTQMFGTEVDFGFSKTKAEAFQKWNHERVLYDAVRAVRIYRPLIIAAVFSGAVTDGHGQHQVSGQIAQEVFKAAGDPNVFPELTKEGILPWQPLKVYARVPFARVTPQGLYDYATGQTVPAEFTNYVTGEKFTTEPTADVTVHEGADDPLLSNCAATPADLPASMKSADCTPLSYVQFARIGLGLQRTQIGGGDRVSRPGRVEVSYHRYGSKLANQPAHEDSFFDGIDVSLAGIASLAPDAQKAAPLVLKTNLAGIAQRIETAQKEVSSGKLDDAANDLATALKLADMSIEDLSKLDPDVLPTTEKENVLHELRIKRAQLNDALALSLGLQLDASSSQSDIVADSKAPVTETLGEQSKLFVGDIKCAVRNSRSVVVDAIPFSHEDSEALASGHSLHRLIEGRASLTGTVTRPYFFRTDEEQPVYMLRDAQLRNAATTPSALTAWCTQNYQGTDFTLGRVVHSGSQPVRIIPPVSLTLDRNAQVLPNGTHSLNVDVHTISEDHPQGELRLHAPTEWTIRSPQRPLRAGTETFSASLPTHALTAPATLRAEAIISGTTYTEGFRPIGYGNLPRTNSYTPATLRVVPVDLKLPPENKRRIAYLPGTGDAVPAALSSIGLAPTILKVSDLTAAHLARFDTVVLGVRTYNAHPDLHGAPTQALLDFARGGGNVVVQYQTPEFTAADAPYPISVSRGERVIDETDPVKILDPNSTLLTTPNRITSADFDNWIEERGHGFPDSWDPHYTALTEVHDPGAPAEHIEPEAPQRGGILTVQLGKGRWTYCAFALYRQLPEAVPGAFRIFVNLLNP